MSNDFYGKRFVISQEYFVGLAIIIVLATAFIDYITGNQLELSVFYIIPIAITVLKTDKKYVLPVAVLSALTESGIKILGTVNYSDIFIYYWNIIINSSNYILIAFLGLNLKSAYENEKTLARVDFLTGILNWKAFYEILEREVKRVKRCKQVLSVAYIDCDNFKHVNDVLGHHEGNNVLAIVASTIEKAIRQTDYVARLGGDEFAILLTDASSKDAALVIYKIKRLLLAEMAKYNYPVTFSIGLASFEKNPVSADEILRIADSLMYQVKNNYKNNIKHEVITREILVKEMPSFLAD